MATKKRTPKKRTKKRTTKKRVAKKRKQRRLTLRRLLSWMVALAFVGIVGAAGVLWYLSRDLPSVASLRDYRPPQTTRVLDRKGRTIGEIFDERRTVVSMDKIPRVLVLSVLAAEDADFYLHEGLDYPGIMRAISRDLLKGRAAQGASTITQQVVKLLLLNPERTIVRKLRELILARRLEKYLSKDEILHLYLNHINFGHGRYGAQEAAQYYFAKDVSDLTLAEASLIAGVPQAPARLSPRSHPKAAERRQRYVLSQLEAKRATYWPDLSEEDIKEARRHKAVIAPIPKYAGAAPEVMTIARSVLRDIAGEEALESGGYEIVTSIDLDVQMAARQRLQNGLQALDKRQRFNGPFKAPKRKRGKKAKSSLKSLRLGRTYTAVVKEANDEEEFLLLDVGGHAVQMNMRNAARYNLNELPASQFAEVGSELPVSIIELASEETPAFARPETGPQGAAIAIDPRSRDVLALIGGYESLPGFNRATSAVRQPGSAFKPLVYALGIQSRRFTAASMLIDAPTVYEEWKPRNYETWDYQGAIRLRTALAQSINMVAIRLIEALTPRAVAMFAEQLGITTELEEDMSLALGSSGVRPIELANAYATFAAGGRWEPTRLIKEIRKNDGTRLRLPSLDTPRDVLSPAEAFIVTSMLRSVVKEGTGARANALKMPVVGKTGTSNEARDAWFVGYSPSTVLAVWVGFDDRRPLGKKESGSRSALPIWIDIMRDVDHTPDGVDFAVPSNVSVTRIDPKTGLLAYEGQEDALEEYFLPGTEPRDTSRPPDVAEPTEFLMEEFDTPKGLPEQKATP